MNLSTLTNRRVLTSAAPAALFFCACNASVNALEVVGKQLEIYATLHPSFDYMDSDTSQAEADAHDTDKLTTGSSSLSFNSSKIGFRGQIGTDIPGINAIYQLEQAVNLDGKSDDTLNTRNSFAGIKSDEWMIIAGRHDSLFKDLALRHSLIKHSIGDRGAILGAGAIHGNQMDKRAENMLLGRYYLPLGSGNLELQAQYSPDAVKSAGNVDNNKREMFAVGSEWKSSARTLAFAYDHWSNISVGSTVGEVNAYRAVWKETGTALTTSLILESIDHKLDDGSKGELDRDAFAFQAAYKYAGLKYLGQVMMAGDYADVDDSGATMLSMGVEKSLSGSTKVYAMYTQTDNDKNAAYQAVDGTHGDELATTNGGTPKAFSVGSVINF